MKIKNWYYVDIVDVILEFIFNLRIISIVFRLFIVVVVWCLDYFMYLVFFVMIFLGDIICFGLNLVKVEVFFFFFGNFVFIDIFFLIKIYSFI